MTSSLDEIRERAPKKSMFRLTPASAVAEVAWQAYRHPSRLHWYVPPGIRWVDRLKGLSPELVRRGMTKSLPALTEEE
jgi:hypothetical protein